MQKLTWSIADLLLTAELLRTKIEGRASGGPVTESDAWQFASAYSIRLRRRYTLARVCRAWRLPRSTVYRHRRRVVPRGRHAKISPTDSQIVACLRDWIATTPFPAERHRKLWARLRHFGLRVSRERVRRLVREHQLLPRQGQGVLTERPDVMWGIDSAKVRTDCDGYAFVLYAIDHCTSECLAIDAVLEETVPDWLRVIMEARRHAAGASGQAAAQHIVLRHDNLTLFRTRAFREPLRRMAMRPSAIFPLYPQGNACAERFTRTLRENLLSIQSFADVTSLRSAVRDFRRTYNRDWLLTRWQYASPSAVRNRLLRETLFAATLLYPLPH